MFNIYIEMRHARAMRDGLAAGPRQMNKVAFVMIGVSRRTCDNHASGGAALRVIELSFEGRASAQPVGASLASGAWGLRDKSVTAQADVAGSGLWA